MSHATAPTAVERAVSLWNQLLEAPHVAEQTHEALMRGIDARGLRYGTRPISTFLRPRFISSEVWRQCERAGAWFHVSLARLMPLLAADRAILDDLGIHDGLADLVHACASPSPLSFLRLDGFMDDGVLRLVEFNADSPGGAAFVDGLDEVYRSLPIFQAFSRQVALRRRPSLPLIWRAVESAARFFRIAQPRVAIVDWREVATVNEFHIIAADLERHGIAATVCDPREIELRGDVVMAAGSPVDIVLKRVLVTDLAARPDDSAALVEALRRRLVVALNPVAVQAVTTKNLLALFWEGRFDRILSARARAVWKRHIPLTLRVRDGAFERDGRKEDIGPWILANRERLVLKPSDAWGADGVRLGWTCTDGEWSSALAEALRVGDHVVQERVAIPLERYPELDEGVLRHRDMRTEISPYTFSPRTSGEVLARLSANDLMNVKTGGGVVATYVVDAVTDSP
ncbi:MAG: hypothetical protein EB084_13725 [Proteobacteria bacterium]|nr:hypothetical protein [Pseudomonadota bacterium]